MSGKHQVQRGEGTRGQYFGVNCHITGIHSELTRERLATILRQTRKHHRLDAREYRDYLIYLGTYPVRIRKKNGCFQGYGWLVPVEIIKWDWSVTFARPAALVRFDPEQDKYWHGNPVWTYPEYEQDFTEAIRLRQQYGFRREGDKWVRERH